MKLKRKPVPEKTWRLMDRAELAFRLEGDLLDIESMRFRYMPEYVKGILNKDDVPKAAGWNKHTGYFVLSAGYGACIDFIENEHVMVPLATLKHLQEAIKSRQYDVVNNVIEHLSK